MKKQVVVNDLMQRGYIYERTARAGRDMRDDFQPAFTPQQMLELGVFEGKYMNDCRGEFPAAWFKKAKTSRVADPAVNYFGVKSRLSLQEWRRRGWIPCAPGDPDVRGWFQWFCRYWSGRRLPHIDDIQINRWKKFKRHYTQVKKNTPGDLTKRRKQRQALLQWSWDCFV